MALELETEVMQAIGLGNHFNYFNGSSSCGCVARMAAERLYGAIDAANKAGKEIAPPNGSLVRLLMGVAETEARDTTLTRTWQAASDIIRAHIDEFFANKNPGSKRSPIEESFKYVEKHYLNFPDDGFPFGIDGRMYMDPRTRWARRLRLRREEEDEYP